MNTGSILAGRPAMGGTTYGLGSANRNLPSFVILLDDKEPVGAQELELRFPSGDLPGHAVRQGDTPILHLKPPQANGRRARQADFLKR